MSRTFNPWWGGARRARSLVKFCLDYNAEVALSSLSMDAFQFQHHACCIMPPSLPMLSSSPGTGHQMVCGISLWVNAMEYPSILLSTASPPRNQTASHISCLSFSLRCAHSQARRTSVNGGPYPWNPPHAFPGVKEYLDYYRGNIPQFLWTRIRGEAVQLLPDKGLPNWARLA